MSTPRKIKHPKVILRKLGREKAYGYYDGRIYIDPGTRGRARLEVMIHEYLHHLDPALPEETVTSHAHKLADFLHIHHVRITEPEAQGLNE